MKKLFRIFIIILSCVVSSCTKDYIPDVIVDDEVRTCLMTFTASLDDYNGTTRSAGEYEWADGDRLYITFNGEGFTASGVAQYAAEDSLWVLEYSGSLVRDIHSECRVRFFENAVHYNDTVSLTAHSSTYASSIASYVYDGELVRLKAHLAPATGRVRLVSDKQQSGFSLSGVAYSTHYVLSGDSMLVSCSPVALTMSEGEDSLYTTDYIYASYADTERCRLEVITDSLSYFRSYPAAMLHPGSSGYIKCPTRASHDGWTIKLNLYDYVDLGLPSGLLWATCNVGAANPWESGDYYAWGEINTKDSYSNSNCVTYGVSLGYISGNAAYDAARANWGGDWRVPTSAEMEELKNSCTWEWVTQNGVYGRKVTGGNGRSIFLPAAGYKNGTSEYDGSNGYYWTLTSYSSTQGYQFYFGSQEYFLSYASRSYGFNVRPVFKDESFALESDTIAAAVAAAEYTAKITTDIVWVAEEAADWLSVEKIDASTLSVHVLENINTISRSARITIKRNDNGNELGSIVVMQQGADNVCVPVNLGLPSGILWATCNVGSTLPEIFGYYYAWGETVVKDSYSEENSITSGVDMDDISGDSIYDVAAQEWGDDWRMPTKSEMDELKNNCTWEWVTVNEVYGYRVTGKNGNHIFLPAAGYMGGTTFYSGGGNYWLSTPYDTKNSYYLYFNNSKSSVESYSRSGGRTVRPVISVLNDGDTFKIENDSVAASSDAGDYTVTIDTNVDWSVDGDSSWITSLKADEATLSLHVSENCNSDVRNGRVIIRRADNGLELGFVTVTQGIPSSVDLGLPSGLRWATCNVGAESPVMAGNYYAWGELEPKENYSSSTNTTYGVSLGDISRLAEYDVARAKLGGEWRMPTSAEFTELRNNCTWQWVTKDGVPGYKVTGANGNYIFLPAAGRMNGTSYNNNSTYGYYFTSSPYNTNYSYVFYFYNGNYAVDYIYRYYGCNVRPVIKNETFSLGSTALEAPVAGGEYIVSVASNVAWTATSSETWLTAEALDEYSLKLQVAENSYTSVRTATVALKLSGSSFVLGSITVTQAGNDLVCEAVDLGLPSGTRWATCNVGANKPESYGEYFAWGETSSKSSYTSANYTASGLSQDIAADSGNDAARVKWGDAWRMPTDTEFAELKSNCTWSWTTRDGTNGYLVTGNNGNSIFLPAAGYYDGTSLTNSGSYGYFWTSGYKDNNAAYAYYIYSSNKGETYYNRYSGRSIRPVINYLNSEENFTLGATTLWSVAPGGVYVVNLTTNVEWSAESSEEWVIVSKAGESRLNVQVFANTLTEERKATITFKRADNGKVLGTVMLTQEKAMTVSGTSEGHDYVDLGLPSGLKWATCNIGAGNPSIYGGYYAWGEIETKETYSSSNSITYGKSVGNITANDAFDAASGLWGGGWYIPTQADFDELRTNCTWTWTTYAGVYGFKVTGTNGNTLFLPASGYYNGSTLNSAASYGYYWTSTSYNTNNAYNFYFYNNNRSITNSYRYYGYAVRPVIKEKYFVFGTNTVEATAAAAEYAVEYITDLEWNAESSAEWLTFEQGEDNTLKLIVAENRATTSRTATITVKRNYTGEAVAELQVVQDEFVVNFTVATTSLTFPATQYRKSVAVTSNVPWTATSNEDWVSFEYTDAQLTIIVARNRESVSRTATVTFKRTENNGGLHVLTVTQERAPVADVVDLGLSSGTKWATCNIGAYSPEEYGRYYAWGEVETKSSYSSSTSKTYGVDIDDISVNPSYDAASANWGYDWRMPTSAEFQELLDNCTWEWITYNGKNGYKVTGSNGNYIFLPAAGYYTDSSLNYSGSYGRYFTTSLGTSNTAASSLTFNSSDRKTVATTYRYSGFSIRPVSNTSDKNIDMGVGGFGNENEW